MGGDDARPEGRARVAACGIGIVGPSLLVERPQAFEGSDDDHQRGVAATIDDRMVKLLEDPSGFRLVLGFDRSATDVQLAQLRHERHVAIGSLRAVRGADRFDHGERRREIVERDVASLQDEAEGAGGVLRSRSVDLCSTDIASANGDEALALEDPERFPEGRARDLELTDELVLLRQHAPVGERPCDDARPDDIGDHLGDTGLGKLTTLRRDHRRFRRTRHRRCLHWGDGSGAEYARFASCASHLLYL